MTCRQVAMALVLAGVPALAGCVKCPETFVPLETLAGEYNANAARVQRLWAQARLRVTVTGKGGMPLPAWGSTLPIAPYNGQLRLWKEKDGTPNFVLVGREITELFRVGTDAQSGLYYFWYHLGRGGHAWVGRTRLAGAPGITGVPIDPLQLVEILGVTELPMRAGELPAVVMTLQSDPCAYVVRYLKPQPISGRLKLWREIYFRWEDGQPRRPYRIRLLDADGRCRVVADVADYKPVEWSGPEKDAPVMPTDFRIKWPAIKGVQTSASIHMTLSGMSTIRGFRKSFFGFASHLPAGIATTQVDARYGPIGKEQPNP